MAVVRVAKTKDYTVMSNHHFKEKEMSLKAKGLLSLMLSLPDDWDYTIKGLVAINKENESAIMATLKELKSFGYLEVIKKMPNETESGRIEYEYIVHEEPKKQGVENLGVEKQGVEKQKQGVEKQGVENLGVENQGIENQIQLNTKELNTKESNTKKNKYKKEKLKKEKSFSSFPETEECKLDILEPEDKYPPLPPLSEYPF